MTKKIGNIELEYLTLQDKHGEDFDYCTINGQRVSFGTWAMFDDVLGDNIIKTELKKAKAFDIIVAKRVYIPYIKECCLDEYNLLVSGTYVGEKLTQEEWDLLKEVLQ